jgi:multimeric flavodoxin WrbA
MKKHLLIIATDPSPNTIKLREQAIRSVMEMGLDGLTVTLQTPEQTCASDVAETDGVLFGTTENLGYMAGLTKDLFDRCFYDWEDKTEALPVGLYIRAGSDGTGTHRALEAIFTGLNWRLVQPPLILRGDWDDAFLTAVADLAMTMAAGIDAGLY